MSVETNVIDRLITPVGECLTPEVAQRIATIKADGELQRRVDELARKANSGRLNEEERAEYETYVNFADFVALLQIKARNLLEGFSQRS